jgi:hypothetical protein
VPRPGPEAVAAADRLLSEAAAERDARVIGRHLTYLNR